MKYGFLLLLQLFTVPALAQTFTQVAGIVFDHKKKPLPDVTVRVLHFGESVLTDSRGRFSLQLSGRYSGLVLSKEGYRTDTVTVGGNSIDSLVVTLFPSARLLGEVKISGYDNDGLNARNWKILQEKLLPSVSGNFESLLKSLPGVSPNNELTSRYAVRGGNFDENLLYVNDIEVYQPFLVRNGQQEGLSFINPELAGSARFSAGGFEARYGDKMSSVLDITYRKPDSSGISFSAGIPGSSLTVKHLSRTGKSYLLAGLRQKGNRSVLESQETAGTYQPRFYDLQVMYGLELRSRMSLSYLGNYNLSRFRLLPEDRESEFGTVSDVYRLEVRFEGLEQLKYHSFMNALTLRYRPSQQLQFKWIQSAFRIGEQESTDLQSLYLFGNKGGEGSMQRVGRQYRIRSESMESGIYASEVKGSFQKETWFMEGGVKYRYEDIRDRFLEDLLIDSAANSLPYTPAYRLTEHHSAENSIRRSIWSGYLQNTLVPGNGLKLTGGMRLYHEPAGKEWILSPRLQLSYAPPNRPGIVYRLAGGVFAQPAFYREMRYANGTLAGRLPAQRSLHLVSGLDKEFSGFPMKMSAELYYKHLTRLIPYKVEDLQIRYFPDQSAHGYAMGADLTLSGELVPALESAFRLSLLKSAEDIDQDFYMRTDASGKVFRYEPGYIRRPTDQRVNMAVSFQDRLFSNPSYKVHLSMLYGGPLPAGPPGTERYADRFSIPAYKRADIGFSRDWTADGQAGWLKGMHLRSLVLYAGIFNLFGNQNTVSYLWIKDINSNQFAVPNYLSGRILHVRVIGRFGRS